MKKGNPKIRSNDNIANQALNTHKILKLETKSTKYYTSVFWEAWIRLKLWIMTKLFLVQNSFNLNFLRQQKQILQHKYWQIGIDYMLLLISEPQLGKSFQFYNITKQVRLDENERIKGHSELLWGGKRQSNERID